MVACFGGNNTSGPIDVATARSASGSASGRLDFESETFAVSIALRGREGGGACEMGDDKAHALRCGGGGGDKPHVLAFDTTQMTSRANRSNPHPGDPCHPLASGAHAPAIAFPGNLSGTQCAQTENLAPAMGAKNPTAVAFTLHGADKTVSTATPTDLAGSIRTKPPGSIENSSTTIALSHMQVRRLTPRECERLQGFPDDYTLIPWRGKPAELCPDGPRYKALGNSKAVPVVRWIGRRIEAVENILGKQPIVAGLMAAEDPYA
jgi:DNA (cytosine-5)-methyltransferase 1